MTKKSLVLFLCLFAAYYAKAALEVSKASDGTVTLTLNASGDLSNGFASLASDIKQADKVIVVTKGGVSMTDNDVKTLCGDWGIDNFPNIVKLNLENARLASDADLWRLKLMNNLKSITFSKYTTKVPDQCLIGGGTDNPNIVEEIIIPDNPDREVTLGTQAFALPTLKKVILGTSIREVGHECFLNCTSLTTVIFHHGTKKIGTHSFYGCSVLTDLVLPEGLEEIGVGAFEKSALTSIRLPSTLKYIRREAFGLCHNLKSITIPEKVEQIEYQAFQECYNLTDVYVLGENTKCANQSLQPVNTYAYRYDGAGNGEEVERNAFRSTDPKMNVRTVLHYPKNAYGKYINDDIKKLGTPGYDRKWVQLKNGNRCATIDDGRYDHNTGDYAGWHNFMLTAETRKDEEIWEDETRVDDKWYTMCLPFDITRDQLESAYGAFVEVVEFSGVEVKKISEGNKTITLKFKTQVQNTVAHRPYMIHPGIHKGTETGVKCVITGIKRLPETQEALDAQKVSFTADNVTYTFIGNYDKTKKLQPHSYYYYSGTDVSQYPNGFYKWGNTEGGKWTTYTACVLLDKDNGAKSKAETEYFENEDEIVVDGIYNMTADEYRNNKNNNVIYNVYGHAVGNGTDGMDKLPKGVYIVNGKKYIVK